MSRNSRIAHRPSSPTLSTFAPSKILPTEQPMDEPEQAFRPVPPVDSALDFSADETFNEEDEQERPTSRQRKHLSAGAISQYDLAAPPPVFSYSNGEYLADRLFSADHLSIILSDPVSCQRFTGFLNRYRPHSAPTLVKYLESQKAMTAIRYANSLACHMSPHSHQSAKNEAAHVDAWFESAMRRSIDELVSDALPAYITHQMVAQVTEILVKEITGNNTPLMKELIQGLAEVYCMTDPSLPDNPIIFASEGFYKTTQYGQEYVIGKNCRFLQGPKTQTAAVKRISKALRDGTEICEILLNYCRDGTPFLNLVMMAPLMDHHGKVRYVIGCQIDITHFLDGGRGLDTFKQLLDKDQNVDEKPLPDPLDQRPPLKILRELGALLNDEEIDAFQSRSPTDTFNGGRSTPAPSVRRYVGMDDSAEAMNFWPPSQFGPSGRLPGVYQNYMLVRPYPSLRITFTSAALRIPGLTQSRLTDRIGGPAHVREGLIDALAQGLGVTAKISWLTKPSDRTPNQNSPNGRPNSMASTSSTDSNFVDGRPRWIHCTPLLGSDSKPGVIMVVMVDKEEITGNLARDRVGGMAGSPIVNRDNPDNWPLHGQGKGLGSWNASAKLYAEYLRREGRDDTGIAPRGIWADSSPGSANRSLRGGSVKDGVGVGVWSERNGDDMGSGKEETRSRRTPSTRRTNGRRGVIW